MKTVFAKYACTALLASCVMVQAPLAQAAMVSTQEAVSAQQIQQDREKVRSFLDRATVQDKLQAMGVESAFAKDRVDALTNEEVVALAKKIDSMPAGGMLGTMDIILIVLLVILVAVLI
jgi:hypothetical protein